MSDKKIPPEIVDNLRRWGLIGNTLRSIQVILGVVGTAAGLYVATFVGFDKENDLYIRIATAVAGFCFGILSAFNVGGKADSIRRAWRHVTAACMLYRETEEFNLDKLVKAYVEAEAMVGDVPFQGKNAADPQPPKK